MPFCPRCKSEYRPGFSRCADCDVELVAALPTPQAGDAIEGWVEVFRGAEIRANVIRAALEEADIETVSPDEQVSNLGWYAPGTFNFMRVLVKDVDAAAAKQIVDQIPPPK